MGTDERLLEQLNKIKGSRTAIVTIGNVLRGDDAAGPLVFERLRKADISAELIDTGTVPENYIQPIIRKAPDCLLIIDAMDFAAPAGTIQLFGPGQLDSFILSTHTLSPRVFADLISREINVDIHFIGIQPLHMRFGQPVSEQVKRAVEQLYHVLAEVF